MKPPIITSSPVCTKARVLTLPNSAGKLGAQYLPPVFKMPPLSLPIPPQTIISLPVHTAVCKERAEAFVVLVAVQLSVLGLYLPPLFNWRNG
jgi:hypothetical protein